MTILATVVEPGWTEEVITGPHSVLFYADDTVRFKHTCDRAHRNAGVIVCAPLLQLGAGHAITQRDPLTITPSILCSDFGTHGFVTHGEWVGA